VLRHEFIPYRVAHTLMAWRVLSRARRVVSVSPYVATHIRRVLGYRGEAEIIPNGMAQPLFDRTRPPRDPGEAITYATLLNTWNSLKNGRAALQAFGLVRRRRPDDRLVMIGHDHGPGGPAEAWAGRHGLEAGVRFVGYLPHGAALDCLASEVDVLVHPSREESFGMTLLEASSLSIPSIAGARSGAVPWTLAQGEAGLLVDVTSAKAIAEAMLKLAGDAGLRAALGQRARANALSRFHVQVVADAYLRAYAQVARPPR
jgi:glycosyltransferase involved in cell wall biosynthesis